MPERMILKPTMVMRGLNCAALAIDVFVCLAIQQPAMNTWHRGNANLDRAQQALYHRAKFDEPARRGQYNIAMEKTVV
jgi:hypothetical protein